MKKFIFIREKAISGFQIFCLMDSYGLPLEMILNRLAECELTIDMMGFIMSAIASGNYKYDKIIRIIRESFDIMGLPYRGSEFEKKVEMVSRHYSDLGIEKCRRLLRKYKNWRGDVL